MRWRLLPLAATCVVVLGASAPDDAGMAANTLQIELSNERDDNTRHQLAVAYLGGYILNERAPREARLVLVLEDGRRFHAAHFSHERSGARLAFDAPANPPPSGELTALLCKPDRCKKVVVDLDWRASKTR